MLNVFDMLNTVAAQFDHIIFPMHPRTRDVMQRYGIPLTTLNRVTVLDPLPAMQSLSYEKHAEIILTDSGCMQEEAYIFGVPCVTIRNNTERHETVASGANIVTGFDRQAIYQAVETQRRMRDVRFPAIYGKYGVGERIVDTILTNFKEFRMY